MFYIILLLLLVLYVVFPLESHVNSSLHHLGIYIQSFKNNLRPSVLPYNMDLFWVFFFAPARCLQKSFPCSAYPHSCYTIYSPSPIAPSLDSPVSLLGCTSHRCQPWGRRKHKHSWQPSTWATLSFLRSRVFNKAMSWGAHCKFCWEPHSLIYLCNCSTRSSSPTQSLAQCLWVSCMCCVLINTSCSYAPLLQVWFSLFLAISLGSIILTNTKLYFATEKGQARRWTSL